MIFQAIDRLTANRSAISSMRSRRTAAPSTTAMGFPSVDICGMILLSSCLRKVPLTLEVS